MDRPLRASREAWGTSPVMDDLSSSLDMSLWPMIREQCLMSMQTRIDSEVAEAKLVLEKDYASKRANIEAQEAALSSGQEELEKQVAELAADRETFEMEKLAFTNGRHMSDVLTLNLGGEKTVAVQRATLCGLGDSMLASSFSGRWDDYLTTDKDGSFFIDFDPALFMPLLSYLRARRIEDPASPATLPIVCGREGEFESMLKYYGLADLAARAAKPRLLNFAFAVAAAPHGIEITDSCLLATRTSSSHWRRTFGLVRVSLPDQPTSVSFRFQIAAFGTFMMVDDFVMANRGEQPGGPNIGVAAAEMAHVDDQSDVRQLEHTWCYRARDGALLAPRAEEIVGQPRRAPAMEGDILTITLHKDGQMSLAINEDDQGTIFCDLPRCVKPVVEMNTNNCQVRIVGTDV